MNQKWDEGGNRGKRCLTDGNTGDKSLTKTVLFLLNHKAIKTYGFPVKGAIVWRKKFPQ